MPSEHLDAEESPRLDRRQFARCAAAWTGAAVFGLTDLARGQAAHKETPNTQDKKEEAAPTRVRGWCEGTAPKAIYPQDIDGVLGEDLRGRSGWSVSQGRLSDPDAGLSDKDLDETDVLIWWGRLRHDDVPEARAKAVIERVKAGKLGFVALHASYASKPFKGLMGTPCVPKAWREDGLPEHVTVKAPDHPIARGVAPFTIPKTAMYAEPFAVPQPEAVIFVSSWPPGETFRSGLTWTIDKGRVV